MDRAPIRLLLGPPGHVRGFFEALCADNVDIGHPGEM
jgi:hypothetical protein